MSLVQVNKVVANGSSNQIIVTGITTNDTYMVVAKNCNTTTSGGRLYWRVSKSGTLDTTSNYDYATQFLNTGASFNIDTNANIPYMQSVVTGYTDNDFYEITYLNDFYDSSAYSMAMFQHLAYSNTQTNARFGIVNHTVASSSDGMGYTASTGNIASGSTLILYKIVTT